MKIVLTLYLFLIFFTSSMLGGALNGLLKFPYFQIEHYFSPEKIVLNFGFSVVFTSIFLLTPLYKDLSILKKFIFRLGTANFIVTCFIPFLIYFLNKEDKSRLIFSWYSWLVLILGITFPIIWLTIRHYLSKSK